MTFNIYLYNLKTGAVMTIPVLIEDFTDLDYEDIWFDVLDEVAVHTGYQPNDFVEIDPTEAGLNVLQ